MTHGRTLSVATDWVEMTGLCADDRYLMVNPYFHMFGLKAGILACVASGATMLPEAVFDVDRILERVDGEAGHRAPRPADALPGHPRPSRPGRTSICPRLRVAVTGAADIPVELVRRIDDELPFSTVITGYGLTEAGTAVVDVSRGRRRDHRHHGRPAPARLRAPHRRRRCGTWPPGSPVRWCSAAAASWPATSTIPRPPRQALSAGRVVAHRRHRRGRRCRLPAHRRAGQGHVHRGRLQRLSRRDREPPAAPPRHQAGGGDRNPRRAPRRGRDGLRGDGSGEVSGAGRSSSGAGPRWPTTRCRGWWRSSTSCPSTPPAR